MKVVSLNLSTLGSGKYAPLDKTNLANVKWSVNWKEVMGEYYNTNRPCRVKAKVISAASTLLNTTNNLGTIRASFSSNYSNINNGLILGVPIINQTADIASSITQFIGSIAATTLTVNAFGYGQMLQITGGTSGSSTTLTITGTLTAIPVGSVITGQGIVGYTTITAQTAAATYTMSTAQTITSGTLITAALPNNICLPVGALITGNGVSSGTVITAQTGPYAYTINNSHTISTIPMISNPTNYFLYLDTQESFGLSICTPMMNYLNIQFLKPDEQTLMTNIPEYTILLNFDFEKDNAYDSD
jgi:hypothetical protein